MKKLLLMALLCVGATSFAAVQGTTKTADMPISVTGEVLGGNTSNLVIESETAGLNGGVMAFKFGSLEKPKAGSLVKQLTGDFTVKLDNGTEIATEGEATSPTANKLVVGLDASTFKKSHNVADVSSKQVALDYILSGKLNEDRTAYNGQVMVQATLTSSSVAGAFSDSQRIYARVGAID